MRTSYHFDPIQTRRALVAIGKRFPLGEENQERLLRILLEGLHTTPPEALKAWAAELSEQGANVLAKGYQQTNNPTILRNLSAVFGYRKDQRMVEVLERFLFQLPSKSLLDSLDRLLEIDLELKTFTSKQGWLGRYISQGQTKPLLSYALQLAIHQKIPWSALLGPKTYGTPFCERLQHFLFHKEPKWMAKLPASIALELAENAFSKERFTDVRAYLQHYPEDKLSGPFLVEVYKKTGALNSNNPFYKNIPTGRIWQLRERLFDRIAAKSTMELSLREYLRNFTYRISHWINEEEGYRIELPPLIIVNEGQNLKIFREGTPTPLEDLCLDFGWKSKLEQLLSDYPTLEKIE